jgi:type VI secretion system protein ImpL
MKKLINIIIILLFTMLILYCLAGAVLNKEQWHSYSIAAGVITLLFICIMILKRILIRNKIHSFIKRVIRYKGKSTEKQDSSTRDELRYFDRQWSEAIKKLKGSNLKMMGNPLYVLPWYLVIGESGMGKTSMLKHSGLSSLLSDLNTTEGYPVTKNCDWWFFNEAIVLDTAGRYTVPIDQDHDNEEWELFLNRLAAFRKKEPVNGIVAAISADSLSSLTPAQLILKAQQIRARIDQVMRILGASFPVYIMITKMDLVFAMPELFRSLPQSKLSQAMGWCNKNGEPFSAELISKAIRCIGDNLKHLQFTLLHRNRSPEAEILIFPVRFLELSTSLTTFSTALFAESVYHVSPLFRGIYFSSSLQKIEDSEADESSELLTPQTKTGGLFLQDFFSSVLPGDRKLHWQIPQYRKKITRLLTTVLTSITAIWVVLAAAAVLSFSYQKRMFNTFSAPQANTFSTTLSYIEALRKTTDSISLHNRSIFPPPLGLHQALETEIHLKTIYTTLFRDSVLEKTFLYTDKLINEYTNTTNLDSVIPVIDFLGSLISTIRHSSNTTTTASLKQVADNSLLFTDTDIPASPYSFSEQFSDYVQIVPSDTVLTIGKKIFSLLALLIERMGNDLEWCTRFPIHGIEDITLAQFWSGAAVSSDRTDDNYSDNFPSVNGAYTNNAYRNILQFFMEIDSALIDSAAHNTFAISKFHFMVQYRHSYYKEWYAMTENFLPGIITSLSPMNQKSFYRELSSGDDPFLRYLAYLAKQCSITDTLQKSIQWCEQVLMLDDLNTYSINKQIRDSTKSVSGKLINRIKLSFYNFSNTVSSVTDETNELRTRKIEQSAASWQNYRKSLAALGSQMIQPEGIKKYGQGLFKPDDSTTTLYNNTVNAFQLLRQRLFGYSSDEIVWSIISGPLTIVNKQAYVETGRAINELWSRKILSRIALNSKDTYADLLFSPDSGLVRTFLEDPYVSSFMYIGPDGLLQMVKGALGALNVSDDFVSFVNNGLGYNPQVSYPITIHTVPFSVNIDAAEEPYQTILRMQCAEEDQVLENFNNNETIDLVYHPESCGRVTLKAVFPSFIAVKTFDGRWAFPQFLQSFKSGTVILEKSDFDPPYQKKLSKANIRQMRFTYSFSPQEASDITRLLDYIPNAVPEKVIINNE